MFDSVLSSNSYTIRKIVHGASEAWHNASPMYLLGIRCVIHRGMYDSINFSGVHFEAGYYSFPVLHWRCPWRSCLAKYLSIDSNHVTLTSMNLLIWLITVWMVDFRHFRRLFNRIELIHSGSINYLSRNKFSVLICSCSALREPVIKYLHICMPTRRTHLVRGIHPWTM